MQLCLFHLDNYSFVLCNLMHNSSQNYALGCGIIQNYACSIRLAGYLFCWLFASVHFFHFKLSFSSSVGHVDILIDTADLFYIHFLFYLFPKDLKVMHVFTLSLQEVGQAERVCPYQGHPVKFTAVGTASSRSYCDPLTSVLPLLM